MNYRLFAESDFSETDGYFKYEKGDGIIYPPELWESNDSFRARLQQFKEGCWACVNDADEVVGYMFSHPYVKGQIVPLNCKDFRVPPNPDCYYVHDIAVLKEWRNRGIGKGLLQIAIEVAVKHGFNQIRGVSVLGSHGYWKKHGFEEIADVTYAGQAKVIALRLDNHGRVARRANSGVPVLPDTDHSASQPGGMPELQVDAVHQLPRESLPTEVNLRHETERDIDAEVESR